MKRHYAGFPSLSPERVVESHFASSSKRAAVDEKANGNAQLDSFAGAVCAIAIDCLLRLLRRSGDRQQANGNQQNSK